MSAIALKQQEVASVKAKIEKAKAVLLIDYMGLTVEQDTSLRAKLREAGIEYKVIKNTIVRRAFNEAGTTEFDEALNGPTAFAFGYEDEATVCKLIYNASKDFKDKFNIKCGRVEGNFQTEAEINVLAQLPSRNELIAQLMATMMAPVQYVVYGLDAIKTKMEENA